jgi:hypothetical protein
MGTDAPPPPPSAALTVAVTGATGFIGRRLCAALGEAGHGVVVVSRDAQRAAGQVPEGARYVAWPGGSAPLPGGALAGVDAVVNLAGEGVAGR